jgi:hypothetical protein
MIKLYFTDRPYYEQRKRFNKLQREFRKKLRKQAKEFRPWSGYYIHEMIQTMLEFYHKTYAAKDCCWSESARLGRIEKSLADTLQYFDALDKIDCIETYELLEIAEKEPEFENYLAEWSKDCELDVTDKRRGYLAYSFLEKIYTERLYNNIGKHIWDWCD